MSQPSEDPTADGTDPEFAEALAGLELPRGGATDVANARLSALLRADKPLGRGAVLGRYVVLEELGRGGMGAVFAAYDPQLDRRVAIKVLLQRSSTPEGNARLLEEARALARLRHANVVTVHDVGEREGTPFLAMEFIEGQTLRDWLGQCSRSWREVVDVMVAAGRGLAAAHAAGIVHRDFKPLNVMLEGGSPHEPPSRVIVMDFGLARIEAPADSDGDGAVRLGEDQRTPSGAIVGTPAYMSSEQFCEAAVGPPSDQFSYCVTFYEALFGERPFEGRSVTELAAAVTQGQLRPVPSDTGVPRWLIDVLHRGMQVDPARRHPSMEALLAAIDRGAGRRRRVALAIGAFVLVGGAAALALRPTTNACDRAIAALQAEWTEPRAASLAAAFEATGHPSAGHMWPRSRAAMDRFVVEWADQYRHVCSDWASSRPPEILAARRACLDAEREHFTGLLEVFAQPTRATVGVAAAATSGLPVPSDCAAIDDLDAVPAEGWTQEILAAQSDFARALARDSAGDPNGARELLTAATDALGSLDAPHTRAEILGVQARLQFRAGEYEAATAAIDTAQRLAARSHDARLVAGLWIRRVVLLRTHRPDEPALPHLLAPAELAVTFAGEPDALVAQLRLAEGMAALDAGDPDDAARAFDAALAVAARGGVDPQTIANVHDNLSRAHQLRGDPASARDASLRALDVLVEAYGPAHPMAVLYHQNVAAMCLVLDDRPCARTHIAAATEILDDAGDTASLRRATNRGFWAQLEFVDEHPEAAREHATAALAVLTSLGREDSPSAFNAVEILRELAEREGRHGEAVTHARHLRALNRAEFGPTHPDVAWAEHVLGEALRDDGQLDAAIEAWQAAMSIYDARPDTTREASVATRLALASALWQFDRDRGRAQQLVHEALAITAEAETRRELETWLATRGLPSP